MLRADNPMGLNEQQQSEEETSRKGVLQESLDCRKGMDAAEGVTYSKPPCGETAESGSTLDSWTLVTLASDALKGKNYTDAVDFFSQALEVLVPQVGQFAKELGPVYTAYGKALLQLGIESKDNVLLNKAAIPESLVEGIAASTLPGGATDGKVKKTKIVNLDDVAFEGDEEVETGEAGDGSSDEQKANEPASGDDHSEVDGAEGGDDDELQLAWEVLDVARMIYADSASIDAVAKVRLADVHVDLGDVAMEMESFSQAADEFSKALELKVSSDEKAKNERDIASVYFKLAMALEYDGRPKEALFPLTTSLSLLKRRLEQLSGQVGDADDKGKEKTFADNPAPVGTDAEELNELQQLLPEVKDKLEDIRSQLRTEPIAQIEMQDSTALEVKAAVAAAAQGAIQDLSGLVRKRKSPQE